MAKKTASPESKHRYTNILIENETGETEVGGKVNNSIKPAEVLQYKDVSETGEETPITRRRSTAARKRGSVHIQLSNGQRVILPYYSKPPPPEESDHQNTNQSKSLDCVKLPPQSPRAANGDHTTASETEDNKTAGDGIEIVWQSRPYQYLAVVLSKRSTSSVRLQTALRYVPEVQVPIKATLENATRRVPQLKPLKSTRENSTQRELLKNESLLDEESSTSCDDHDFEFDDEVSSESDVGLALITTLTTCASTPDESSERLRLAQSHLKQPIYMFRIHSSSISNDIMEWDVPTSVTTVSSSETTETVEESFTDMSATTSKGCCTKGGWFRCGEST